MAVVALGVLGSLTADVDGRRVTLGGPRQRAVLAVLAIARRRVVPAERIVSAVWGTGRPPAPTTLHAYISQLRRALEPERRPRTPARVLVRDGPGYVLRLTAEAVDAERFTELATRGGQALRRGDPGTAAAQLDAALALWRGPAYADLRNVAFTAPEVARLENLRLTAREDRFAAQLELGRHAAVAGELRAHVAEHPLSERGWELLVLALYRSGRQSDALRALRDVRRTLADELGLDPGPALRELEAAVRIHDPRLDSSPARPDGPAEGRVPGRTVVATGRAAGNVPCALSSFVGRRAEVARAGELLTAHRLVTFTGPGGVGKTRLALEVARDRAEADGRWVVELAGLEAPELLGSTVADALGVLGAADGADLGAALGDRELILVLDNCEHLVSAAAEFAAALLARAGLVRVLATSREPLGVAGEVVYPVGPLPPGGDAVELFLGRAAAVLPDWTPTEAERETVAAICAALDGMPLAIELAAAQCRVLSIDQIAARLDDRFALLVGGPATGPARHRTLEGTVAWSHRLLDARERELFGRLSVFAGSFDLDAAGAVSGGGPVLEPLTGLVRKSLLTVEAGAGPRRYRMLETLRQYGRRGLGDAEHEEAEARHRAWMLGLVENADRRFRTPDAAAMLAALTRDQPDVRAALTSALAADDANCALRMSGALAWYWFRKGHIGEGLKWLTTALDAAPHSDAGVRARALLGIGSLRFLAGSPAGCHTALEAAAEAAAAVGDLPTEAAAVTYRAYSAAMIGTRVDFVAQGRQGVALARRSGDPGLEAEALVMLGTLHRQAGDLPAADVSIAEGLRRARACGHDWAVVAAALMAMKIAIGLGDAERAIRIGTGTVDVCEGLDDVTSWLSLLQTCAGALALVGHAERGALLLGVAAAHGERIGFATETVEHGDPVSSTMLVRAALPTSEYVKHLARGRTLGRHDANALIRISARRETRRTR
ncbi:AfsR/SARP family transcriptional regulator [Actinomadura scrupuli]|uniref:AfsR/SARP family transcriptional regulator n=1 Tax=Actinomadura scrupuli TaxID=559629 RepID=UPI003D9707D6